MDEKKGIVMLFTGDGKGKTTAAIGAGVRAAGHGAAVFMIQFMKGRLYGELAALKNIENFTIEQHGRDEFVDAGNPEKVDMDLAAKGWARALEIAAGGDADMLILDEINIAAAYGLIPVDEVVRFVTSRPEGLDIIMTGRYAPDELVGIADTVTEMREIRHHYGSGTKMRKGIEY